MLKRVVIRTKAETRISMIKSTDKKNSSVTRKVTQRLIAQKVIRNMARKKKVMTISSELVYQENRASMTSAR